jgi:hypothetical protein
MQRLSLITFLVTLIGGCDPTIADQPICINHDVPQKEGGSCDKIVRHCGRLVCEEGLTCVDYTCFDFTDAGPMAVDAGVNESDGAGVMQADGGSR